VNKKSHYEFFNELRSLMEIHDVDININVTSWDEIKGFNFNFDDGGFYFCACGPDLYSFDLDDMLEESSDE